MKPLQRVGGQLPLWASSGLPDTPIRKTALRPISVICPRGTRSRKPPSVHLEAIDTIVETGLAGVVRRSPGKPAFIHAHRRPLATARKLEAARPLRVRLVHRLTKRIQILVAASLTRAR